MGYTKQQINERERFINIIVQESVAISNEVARHNAELLMRHGKTYARIQEGWCNGVGDSPYIPAAVQAKRQARFEKELEKREKQIENRVRQICTELGVEPIFGGDPRGATIKLKVPSGRTDDWGHEGICVPGA